MDCPQNLCTNSCPPQDEFGDPLTFHLAPSSGQHFNLFNIAENACKTHDIPISLLFIAD